MPIFCLALITTAQPFIDCSGKSFLCENSTHFTICVDVGGGVSMTVGNIVLSCPPTTFCDENNAFECEYRTSTSTSTTPSSNSQDTNIPTETTEARLTTNVYDEFLFTSDSQQAEANVIFPTQQKYIIPGNANVIFDDTDNAVLVYGNIDSEIVNSTPVNEKVPRNLNATNSANINDYKNRTIDVNKKFIRRNKELTSKFEEARRELSTTIAQTTDTTDKIMTTPSDSVAIEESSTVEFLTATTNIEISVTPSTIPDIGRNLSHITNYTSRSNNKSKNTIKNNNLDLTANFTVNNLLDTELGLKVIERAPFNATKSDLTHLIAVSNPNISVNHSHTDLIKDKPKETLQLNRNNRTTTNLLKDNKDTIVQSTTVPFTGSADVTDLNIPTERYQKAMHSKNIPNSSAHLIDTISTTPDQSIKLKLNIPTETYVQNEKFSKDILSNSTGDITTISTTPSLIMEKSAQNAINSSAHLIKTISTKPDDSVILNMNIATESYDENHKFSKDATQSNSTEHFTETITTTPSTTTERYSPNSTISKYRLANTSLLHAEIPTKANESVKSNFNTTVKRYGQNANHLTDSLPLNSGHQIKSTSSVPNKPIKSNLSTPTMRYAQNATFSTDFSKSSKNPIETISTIPVEVVTSILNIPTESYAPNDIFSRGIILPDSLDFNSVGNSLKTSTLRNDKLRDIEKKILFEDLVHPTTVENVTPHLRTTTKTYILNGIMSNPIIPSESSEVDITFGDILKVNKDPMTLNTPKQLDSTKKAILNSTIKADNQENSKVSSHDDTLRTKLSDYINSFNLDVGNNTGSDTIMKKNFHTRNKTTSMANKTDKMNTDAINTTEIITDKIMLGLEYLNGTLYSNVETITEFTTENIVTLQQTNNYQTTSRSNGLEDIKNTLFEDTDYSVLLFPASTVETLVTELSTTPQTYIQNSLISNPIIPNDSPDFDISFGDLIKGNKDFIELKSPLQISFTDRPISDFNGRSENRESLRNFRSTSHNNSLNNDLASNSSDKITKVDLDIFNSTETKNVSVANVTVIDESFVKNEAVIVESETLNKDLTSNLTSLFPNTKIALNTANDASPQQDLNDHELNITTKDIENKNYTIVDNDTLNKDLVSNLTSFFPNTKNALNIAKGASPRYNLTDHELNIATQDLKNKNYTNTNNTMENTTYLPLDEKRIIDEIPMSNMLLKNATEINNLNPNEKDIKGKEIIDTATSLINDILKENKMRKVTDSELLNNTKSELTYSTQSSLETSHYFTYTVSTTINYNKSENKTINSPKSNTTELFEKVILENKTGILTSSNNGETLKNNRDVSVAEDMTESILNKSNTHVDLTNSVIYTEATVTNSFNSKDLAKKIIEGAYFTEEPMPNSSTSLDDITENQPAILFNGNTRDTFTSYKEIKGKIQNADEITSPKYDLSNHTQNITTVSIAEKGHTKANETNINATYLTVNEKKMEKPISNAILQNFTVENSKTLNDEDFAIAPISDPATFIMDDKRKDNKIIKRTDNELLNGSLIVLNYSTQSTIEASEYLTNTEGITVSYDQNKTIDPLKNNTADLIQSETRNNREIANNNSVDSTVKVVTDTVLNIFNTTHIDLIKNFIDTAAPISNSVIGNDQTEKIPTVQYMTTGPVLNLSKPIIDTLVENKNSFYNTENPTERILLTPTTIGSESILNDTFVDVTKKDQRALPISSSINSEGQETDFTDSPMVSTHNNKTPIANSSLTIENKQNRLEKELLEENRKDVKEFVFNSLENVTEPTLNKTTLTKITTIVKKANDGLISGNATNNHNQFYNTKYTTSEYSTPMLTIPLSTMTTEHVYLTTESENGQTTFKSLTPNNATSVTDTSIYETDIKKISNKRNDQNTLYDGFVNSINNDINPTIQVSTSTVRYEDQTALRLENVKENLTQDVRQVNYNVTILSSETINATTAATTTFALKPHNSTFIVINKMNNANSNTRINNKSKILNDHILNDMLLTNKSVMNVATTNKNNARVNKLEQDLNSKNNFSISYDKVGRGKLQLKVHNVTTKSIERNSKVHENIKVDNVTERSQHNNTNTTILKDSKNESIIQKCSNRSICISQANGQVSIELYNKTRINVSVRNNSNSKTKETRVRDNDHVLITTVNNAPKTELGTVNKIVMQTERHDSAIPLGPTYLNRKKETNEMPIKHIETTKSSLILQNNTLQTTSALLFDCKNHSRGRYADKDNCRKFYICIGYSIPIIGNCPENTVFSEFKKQCTNNLSHCIRNNQFKCVKDGRFIDVWQDNMYYVCVKGPNHRFLRLKLECKSGYILDKVNVMCKQGKKVLKTSSSISANSSSSSASLSSSNKKKNKSHKNSNKKSSNDTGFKCNEEGKFVDPNNCRKYYICSKTSKSVLRRKRKKCDSDEVFDDEKKECVDEDSYEC
ncbi:PREDICTED: probable serine/threonine-protein kinase DDB_G0282963 [Papilio polytes]|uniref:probable serine/threonine-protein kinase DDB_G0282963 n=1 Tax=Papilio polytes TaxID=76194 RepID=UPI0006761B15|nr:PREDICTED: probable serine/threonine-protein kinase DDB_G0282963 [Papilio polytes]